MNVTYVKWAAKLLAATGLLAGCGGGGGNPGQCIGSALVCPSNAGNSQAVTGNTAAATPQTTPASGTIPSSASVANSCTLADQQQFTRSYLNEAYLWYNEVQTYAPGSIPTVDDHFYASRTPVRDSTGALKDRFSFIVPLAEAETLATGANVGYGADWVSDSANRTRVTQVAPGSPAALAGLARGGELVRVISTTSSPGSDLLFPNEAAASLTFSYRPTPTSPERTVTLNAVPLVNDPVPQNRVITSASGKRVGYVQFDAHTRGAQDKLIDTMLGMKAAALDSMVLDLRYNGGGFLYTALSLATMLSSANNEGQVFERLQYSDKRPQDSANSIINFSGALQVGEQSYAAGFALPRLALPRVYVLTTDNTCSASESVINSLRGVDVEVVLVGGSTCGKPYGFTQKNNCTWAYFPIEFVGTNAKGFGDYSHGFPATCAGADDLDHPLGNTSEGLLSAALSHVETGSCPVGATGRKPFSAKTRTAANRLTNVTRPQMPGRLLVPRG